jgi:KaiC/GvpD/RAD55 family RecA-like ATPase
MKIHVDGYDSELGGGIPLNTVNLITGTTGTMKSSLSFNIIFNEVKKNKKIALYISLEETFESLMGQMISLGFDLNSIDIARIGYDLSELRKVKDKLLKNPKNGGLIVSDLGKVRKEMVGKELAPNENWFFLTKAIIKEIKQLIGLDIVVLDSLSALHVLSNLENPRVKLFYFFEFLRDLNITSFLLSEMPHDGSRLSTYDEEPYLVDGLIKLTMTDRHRKVSREISVMKMRSTKVNTDVFTLEFKDGKFRALYGGQVPLV